MPQQSFEVELPDGTIIEGPSKEAAMIAARRRLQVKSPANISQPQVNTQDAAPNYVAQGTQGAQSIRPHTFEDTLHNYGVPTTLNDLLAKAIPFVRGAASAVSGAAAGVASGNPVAGSVTMATVDELLRRYATGEESGALSGSQNLAVSIPEAALENEVGGRLIGGVTKGAKSVVSGMREIVKPGSVVDPTVAALKPTFSQYSHTRPGFEQIENTLAPAEKKAAIETSSKIATTKANALISRVTGRNVDVGKTSSEYLATSAQNRIVDQFDQSIKASNAKASALSMIAKANSVKVMSKPPVVSQVASNILDASGKPVMQTVTKPAVFQTIEGPINLDETVGAARKFLADFKTGLTKFDVDSPAYKAATNIIETTEDGAKPIDFKQAWQWKKEAGEQAFGSPHSEVSVPDARFKPVFYALDKDVENSTAYWPKNGPQANQLYTNTKALVNQRHELFSGSNTKILLNNLDQAGESKDLVVNQIDNVINSRPMLQRALNIGKLKLGSNLNPIQVSSKTALSKDLGAFKLKRMFEGARVPNPNGIAGTESEFKFDTTRIFKEWRDNEQSDTTKMLFPSRNQRDQIGQFLKILSLQDQKGLANEGNYYLKFYAARNALGFGSGIATALLGGGSLPFSAAIGGGITGAIAGLHVVGKLLTNPEYARILQAMAQGGPLNMSEKMAARVLSSGLRGEIINFLKPDGSSVPIKFDSEGKPTLVN